MVDIAEEFERKGLLRVRGVVPLPVVEGLREFLIRSLAERYGPGYRPLPNENAFALVKSVRYLVPLAKALQASGVLQTLLGPDLYLRLPPSSRAVHPDHAEGLAVPHQDGALLKDMGRFVTVWVPLVEIDRECRGVGFFPDFGCRGEMAAGDLKGMSPVGVDVVPGDILIFHKWMPHLSLPNTSSRVRYSLDVRVSDSAAGWKKGALDLQQWRVIKPSV